MDANNGFSRVGESVTMTPDMRPSTKLLFCNKNNIYLIIITSW